MYKIVQYIFVTFACLMIAAAINLFFVPHHLLSSGISGLATIFYYLFGWPIGLQILVMNIPLLVLAYRLVGKSYVIATIYGTVMLSLAIDMTKFLVQMSPLDDPLLAAITGGLIAGIGGGLVFRVNASLGGIDIIATIIKKYYSFNVGSVGFAVNCGIAIISATLFGLKLAVITLISMFIGSIITDQVVEGFNRKKSIYIISYKSEDIVKVILKEIGRGVTILHGEGAFTRQDKRVIFVVISLTQIAQIKRLVHEADPEAFVIVNDVTEVIGRGFTKLQPLKIKI